MGQSRTIVHLVRHGEVHNPAGLLYGRLPDYHLSELGREMAERVADYFRRPGHRAYPQLAAGARTGDDGADCRSARATGRSSTLG